MNLIIAFIPVIIVLLCLSSRLLNTRHYFSHSKFWSLYGHSVALYYSGFKMTQRAVPKYAKS